MKHTVKEDITLFDFLQKQYPDTPKTRIKKWLQNEAVRYNNQIITKFSHRLRAGGMVEVESRLNGKVAKKTELPFPILYEDKYIIAIEKPAGIATSSTDNSPNAYKIVSMCLKDQSKGEISAFVVHRLDKEVSGILLFAKSEEIMEKIKDNWKKTEKLYYALVEGGPDEPSGTVKSWLMENGRQQMYSTHEQPDAKFSITHYKVIKQLEQHTLLEVRLETGRKNQIRVHMSDLGCPIAGDSKYGSVDTVKRRIRLHAFSLTLPHPVSGEKIHIESPIPRGFLTLRNHDENYKPEWLR